MTLAEVYGSDFAVRKTVWSKRGDKIVCRTIDQPVAAIAPPPQDGASATTSAAGAIADAA